MTTKLYQFQSSDVRGEGDPTQLGPLERAFKDITDNDQCNNEYISITHFQRITE
jgi:hypothetical protein